MTSKGISKFRWCSINGIKEDNFSCTDFSFRFGCLFVDGTKKRKIIGMESMQRIGLDAVCMTFPGGEHINIFFCDSDTADNFCQTLQAELNQHTGYFPKGRNKTRKSSMSGDSLYDQLNAEHPQKRPMNGGPPVKGYVREVLLGPAPRPKLLDSFQMKLGTPNAHVLRCELTPEASRSAQVTRSPVTTPH